MAEGEVRMARQSDDAILEALESAGSWASVAGVLEDWRQSMPHSEAVQARFVEATRRAAERIRKRHKDELVRARAFAQRVWLPPEEGGS